MRLPLRKVFICYRQADTQVYADRIYDSLSRALCLDVFKDLQRIDIGDSVQKVICAALRDSYALLVIIGPRWLEADATTGKPRLFDASDWVRLEIEQGLQSGCRVIPILNGETLQEDVPSVYRGD